MPRSKRAKVVHLTKVEKKGKELSQRLFAADLVREHAVSAWRPLMLAVDLKGATVVPHPVENSDFLGI